MSQTGPLGSSSRTRLKKSSKAPSSVFFECWWRSFGCLVRPCSIVLGPFTSSMKHVCARNLPDAEGQRSKWERCQNHELLGASSSRPDKPSAGPAAPRLLGMSGLFSSWRTDSYCVETTWTPAGLRQSSGLPSLCAAPTAVGRPSAQNTVATTQL